MFPTQFATHRVSLGSLGPAVTVLVWREQIGTKSAYCGIDARSILYANGSKNFVYTMTHLASAYGELF